MDTQKHYFENIQNLAFDTGSNQQKLPAQLIIIWAVFILLCESDLWPQR